MSSRATETVGQRLKRLRRAAGLSQRDVASPGVSYAYISRIEAEARTPSVKALRKLAEKLGVSLQYLETGYESPIDAGCMQAGLSLRDLTSDEAFKVLTISDAWARYGAYEAALRVLADRDRAELQRLEVEAATIRQRRALLSG